jgi:hypothetical protein
MVILSGSLRGIRMLELVCLTAVAVAVAAEEQQRMQRFGCSQ